MALSTSFSQRIQCAAQFEQALFDKITEMGFVVAMNGTEHTHPTFVERLRQSTDQTSLAIRFQPDGVASIGKVPRSFYVEAKDATTIEKTAWEQYTKLTAAGNLIVLVCGKLGWMWNFTERIRLLDGETTVGRYASSSRFPVIDGWVTPRGSIRWESIRRRNPQASGTPYREIAVESLRSWNEFKAGVIERLADVK